MNLKLNLTVPTNGQVNMMLITKEQYESLVQKITDLIDEKNLLSIKLYEAEHTVWELLDKHENLHNFIIAEARVETQKQKDKEYYTWCEKIAAKYEEVDYEEWCFEKAKYYSWIKPYCEKHNVSVEDARKDAKYAFGCEWDTNEKNKPTEGWTKALQYYDNVLEIAENDAIRMYFKSKKGHSAPKEYYRLLAGYWHYLQQFKY